MKPFQLSKSFIPFDYRKGLVFCGQIYRYSSLHEESRSGIYHLPRFTICTSSPTLLNFNSPSSKNLKSQSTYKSKHSKRNEFRNQSIEIDHKTMKYLDSMGLGMQQDLKSFQRGKKAENSKLKKLLKEGKLDISNLQRMSLSHKHSNHLSKQKKKKGGKEKTNTQIPAINPKKIQYLKSGRFLQFKRAIRKEKRRIAKEAINFNRANLVHQPNKVSSLLSNNSVASNASEIFSYPETFIPKFTRLLASCDRIDEIPVSSVMRPEIAIIGRSNVGKSTLLNSLLAKPSSFNSSQNVNHSLGNNSMKSKKSILACVSSRPGQTTSLNFYRVDGVYSSKNSVPENHSFKKTSLTLIDMPGYGFAFAKDERKAAWYKLMLEYLVTRGTALKRILLLVDARHGLKHNDYLFLQDLNYLNKLLNETKKSYSSLLSNNQDEQNFHSSVSLMEELDGLSLSAYNKSSLQQKNGRTISDFDESPMKDFAIDIFQRMIIQQHEKENQFTRSGLDEIKKDFFPDNQGKKIVLPPIQLVLTKCDLVLREDLARLVKLIRTDDSISQILGSTLPVLMLASTGRNVHIGIDSLKDSLASILKK